MIIIEYLGTLCFALCCLPLAIKCIKDNNADGISTLFLILWFSGEICYIIATWYNFGFVLWMMLNYGFNTILLLIIFYYKIKKMKIIFCYTVGLISLFITVFNFSYISITICILSFMLTAYFISEDF
ncbi:MAG: PQ-loop domain-containing transporter [Candidatus Thorarchaeota archaeon]